MEDFSRGIEASSGFFAPFWLVLTGIDFVLLETPERVTSASDGTNFEEKQEIAEHLLKLPEELIFFPVEPTPALDPTLI